MSTPAVSARPALNPYQPIVGKNVFRLRPPLERKADDPVLPPPVITLQGISSYFHRKQVLLNVLLANRPGESPKQTALVLDEGERVGEIEVLEINERAAGVTFRNHGQLQCLYLHKPR